MTQPTSSEVPDGRRPDAAGPVVIGPDGQPVTAVATDDDDGQAGPADLVEEPAKVLRIGSMIKQLLEEVRSAPLDEASRARLKEIHARSIAELESGLAPELVEELERLQLPFGADDTPSEAELRIAQAQLVGWLEGLFHGIQTVLMAQQFQARAQLEEMRRRAITGGPAGMPPGVVVPEQAPPGRGSGPYL
ncbi:MAG: bacterial proteasome activator family protein [Actinomycetota bacterium]|nr:MAG: bacterial proteasome activator family protein [Actinomycetota bacterium]